jgi:putative nucleotidyltransferase with HDIG domain
MLWQLVGGQIGGGLEAVDPTTRPSTLARLCPQPDACRPLQAAPGSWLAIEGLCTELGRIQDVDELSRRLLGGLCELLAADAGSVMLIDGSGENLRIVAHKGLPDVAEKQLISKNSSVSGIAMSAGRPLLLQGRRPGLSGNPSQRLVECSLVVPILRGEESLGVVNLNRAPGSPSFADTDLEAAAHVVGTFSAVFATAIEEKSGPKQDSLLTTIQALAKTIEAKDPYTRGHCDRVRGYACEIALGLGLDEELISQLSVGATLHDIGKIGVPEQVLTKPGKLTDEEYASIKRHPAVGAEIVRPLSLAAAARAAIEHHHERFDGNGYPSRLKGEQIPLSARILAVADSFDAMTITRPYREAMTVNVAIAELVRHAGSQFDPAIVAVFVKHCEQQQLGTKLASIETARKTGQAATALVPIAAT